MVFHGQEHLKPVAWLVTFPLWIGEPEAVELWNQPDSLSWDPSSSMVGRTSAAYQKPSTETTHQLYVVQLNVNMPKDTTTSICRYLLRYMGTR